ncbi:unnamed protein product [Mytilus coruscus]|uniref:Ig-like domain-containing protein n=1 Tax=Mytilus coruscus TaxID=42192 RepID=A0A6J8CND8_MYTCO|nr:unnamed protein product [Mytilus coruscus]
MIISSGDYDTNKYQVILPKTESHYYKAPQGQFSMRIEYFDLDYGDPKKLILTQKPIGNEKFQLKIMNVSTTDEGSYTCHTDSLWIQVARLRFLNQTNENFIYGQEGKTCNISCTTVTGYNEGELSIHQNDTILATSNSSIVTFSFIPKKHDSFTKYRCVGKDPTLGDFNVHLVINYAPIVKVVTGVNSINCIANGYPQSYIFYEWEHQSENGEHVRFLEGLQNGTLNLQSLSQQYQISGKYICRVSNGIPGLNGSMIQQGFGSLSNMEKISIERDGTVVNVIHDFRISKTALLYTGSLTNGNIGGYEISFEADITAYKNNHVYTIWAENKFGVDSYKFQVIAVESLQCNIMTRRQFIASCSTVVGLLIYLIVSQICFYKRVRRKRATERNIPHDLNIHNYDEIVPIAYQDVNQRPSNADNQELIQQTSFSNSRQAESATNNVRHHILINDSTVESPRVSESSDSELQQTFISEAVVNTTPASSDKHTMQSVGISNDQTTASSDVDNVDNTLRSNQRKMHQDEHSVNSNRSSASSTSSNESRMDSNSATLSRVIVSDGYENPYQIVMQVNQDPHEYTSITQTGQIGSANQSHMTDELK